MTGDSACTAGFVRRRDEALHRHTAAVSDYARDMTKVEAVLLDDLAALSRRVDLALRVGRLLIVEHSDLPWVRELLTELEAALAI